MPRKAHSRPRKGLIASLLGVLVVAATVGATAAVAAITATSGAVVQIAPPASVQDGALQSDTQIRAFDEQQCVTLTSDLQLDFSVVGGSGLIPAGTSVSSHLLHFDPTGSANVTLTGSMSVDAVIIGGIITASGLDASDAAVGAPGTAYPTGDAARGLDAFQGDSVTISGDRLTATTTVTDRFHFDQVRIVAHCAPPPPTGDNGCTPGYWKQTHHFDSWVGFAPTDKYEAVFGVSVPGDPSLLDALNANGGGINALERHSVAALLNASNSDVGYPLTVSQVIARVQAAIAGGTIEQTKNEFEQFNELGCPLN
jgi:hypothetical protein